MNIPLELEKSLQEQRKLSGVLRLILSRLFYVLTILLLSACTTGTGEGQGQTSALKSNPANQISNPDRQTKTNGTRIRESTQKDICLNIRRPLNPDSTSQPSETSLDRYFRLAYDTETEGNFDTSIMYYRRAAELASCECDRLHARAGEQAAKEAKELLKTEGVASKPTQFFWNRLQELTESLSCVIIQ